MSIEHPNVHNNPDVRFARHPETLFNRLGILAGGGNDPETTDLGRQQAHDLAQHIRDSGIEVGLIITTPLQRAYGTAEIVATDLGMDPEKITILENLRERHGGSFGGRPLKEFYEASGEAGGLKIAAAGGESDDAFADKVLRGWQQVFGLAEDTKGTTLVIGHAEHKRMYDTMALGLPPHALPAMPKPANAQLQPVRPIPEERVVPAYFVDRGVVLEKPQDGWVVIGLQNSNGEPTELAQVPAGPDSDLRSGDEVVVAVDTRGIPESNRLARLPKQSRRKLFASRRPS